MVRLGPGTTFEGRPIRFGGSGWGLVSALAVAGSWLWCCGSGPVVGGVRVLAGGLFFGSGSEFLLGLGSFLIVEDKN